MWEIFKADIVYNRILFSVLYFVIISTAAVNALVGGAENILGQMIFFSIVAIGAFTGNEQSRYKMGRLGPSLPVPILRVVLGGHLVWICYWISVMLILWLSTLIGARGHLGMDFFWHILAFTGAANTFVAWMGIFFELRFYFLGKFKKFVLMGAAIFCASLFAAVCLSVARLDPDLEVIYKFFTSPAGALSLLVCSIVSTIFYFKLYANRKSYTE
jgi:hypothetical protein